MTSPFSKKNRLLASKAKVSESLTQKQAEIAVDSMEDSDEDEGGEGEEIDVIESARESIQRMQKEP